MCFESSTLSQPNSDQDKGKVTMKIQLYSLAALVLLTACSPESATDSVPDDNSSQFGRTTLIELWERGAPAFGVFVPDERGGDAESTDGDRLPPLFTRSGGERLASNPLLDYVLLSLEQVYDLTAVENISAGLANANGVSDKTLLVRIPPIAVDGVATTRTRVAESLTAGANGIIIPHIRNPEEARMAIEFFEDMGIDVWSPANRSGSVILMLMIEDAGALAATQEITEIPGYSVLSCGIGSLARDLGDRIAAEAGCEKILDLATRAHLPSFMIASDDTVITRINEGYLGLITMGPAINETIEKGRTAAGR
jgi:hypothetical protein